MLVPRNDEESGIVALKLSATDYNGPVDRSGGHPVWPEVEVEVRFKRREWRDGWEVRRADNGRLLGWLCRDRENKVWQARVPESAFRGDGVNDEGNLLDEVPGYLTNANSTRDGFMPVGADRTREWAARELLAWLVRYHAPAVGYGRKAGVVRYVDKHPERVARLAESGLDAGIPTQRLTGGRAAVNG